MQRPLPPGGTLLTVRRDGGAAIHGRAVLDWKPSSTVTLIGGINHRSLIAHDGQTLEARALHFVQAQRGIFFSVAASL